MIDKRIQSVMKSEVTREEFLKYIGLVLLSFVGVAGIIKNLQNISPSKPSLLKSESSGYGKTPYGR